MLIDRFLEDAIEVDVDALRDRTGDVFVAGIMEHVEEAGVHSGDSACALPPQTLHATVLDTLVEQTTAIAARPRRRRAVQRAVRGEGRRGLRARGEPARVADACRSSPRRRACAVAAAAARLLVGTTLAELRDEGMVPDDDAGARAT